MNIFDEIEAEIRKRAANEALRKISVAQNCTCISFGELRETPKFTEEQKTKIVNAHIENALACFRYNLVEAAIKGLR